MTTSSPFTLHLTWRTILSFFQNKEAAVLLNCYLSFTSIVVSCLAAVSLSVLNKQGRVHIVKPTKQQFNSITVNPRRVWELLWDFL